MRVALATIVPHEIARGPISSKKAAASGRSLDGNEWHTCELELHRSQSGSYVKYVFIDVHAVGERRAERAPPSNPTATERQGQWG